MAIKIRQRHLSALEKNEFEKLPPPAFTRGFIKNYSEFLGLNPQQVLLVYRRQFNERKEKTIANLEAKTALNIPAIRLTPSSILTLLILGCIAIFFLYLVLQYRDLVLTPSLSVSSPKENATIRENAVTIIGRTDNDSKIFINGQNVPVASNGSFNQKLEVKAGWNKITITAVNKRNKTTTTTRSINAEIP
jgi:cytoskeletal protein RodZ